MAKSSLLAPRCILVVEMHVRFTATRVVQEKTNSPVESGPQVPCPRTPRLAPQVASSLGSSRTRHIGPRSNGSVFQTAKDCSSFILGDPQVMTMRARVRKFAHLLERIGLAMAGAASGLFVAAHVGSSIALFTSLGFVVAMMIGGAIGFYLGIDTPALPLHPDGSGGKVDSAEFL